MPTEFTGEHAKALYDLALSSQRAGNYVHALRVLQQLIKIGDPFYTPFALAVMSQCYNALGRPDFEMEAFRRVTELPREQQQLLNPAWQALCYQRIGNLRGAQEIHEEVLGLVPNDPSATAALAEISLLQGNLEEAEKWAKGLRERAEPNLQILGRIIWAFVLALRKKHDESAAELLWVGQFLISSGNVPIGAWDYSDLQPVITKLGANSTAATLLLEVLSGRKAVPEFIEAWKRIAPAA